MIKILFIHNQLVCGGAEQALYDLILLMDKTKFDITVLVQYDGGVWEDKFKQAGIRVVSVWDCQKNSHNPFIRLQNRRVRKKIVQSLENNGEGLLKVCLNEPFDIIVSYNGSTLQGMCFSGKVKTVKYIHGDMATNPEFRKNTMNILDIVRKFDRIICVSNIAQQSFEKLTGITGNVGFHYNPLNSENIYALAQQDIPVKCDMPYVCAVGRLSEEKGFERLIRIHKKLIDSGLEYKLVIVGDGPECQQLEKTICELHLETSVILAGYQANPYPFIKRSKLLVCPSYSEGLGLVAMEAILLGIPVVASVPTVGEIFGDEICGLITENDDASLEAGIRRMLEDQDFYQQAKQAAERRSTFFDGKRMVKEVEEEFISLVHQGM